jgi:hypothetical protein
VEVILGAIFGSFSRHFLMEREHLPRQARDRDRTGSTRKAMISQGGGAVAGSYSLLSDPSQCLDVDAKDEPSGAETSFARLYAENRRFVRTGSG